MIIPPRCFTCGTVIGDKWIPFIETVLEEKQKSTEEVDTELDIDYIDVTNEGNGPSKFSDANALTAE